MKKITLLLFLLTFSFGYSQNLLTNGDFQTGVTAPWTGNAANVVDLGAGNYVNQANVAVAGNAYDVNLSQPLALESGKTYVLSFDAYTDVTTATRTIIAGIGQNAGPWDSLTDTPTLTSTPQTFTYQFTVNYGAPTYSRVIFDMGAATGFVFIDNVSLTLFVADPTTDATLTDLKVDGTTISGFGPNTANYSVALGGGTTIVPQITAFTTSNSSATTVLTQSLTIPGSATVVVTAVDGTTIKTYTVAFAIVGPPIAAPTPPNRNPSDVISLYSGSYTNVASTFDAGWCGGSSVQEVTVVGNPLMAWKGNACQGIVLDAGINASSFTRLHVDVYIEAGTDLTSSVFNLKFVQQPGGGALEINSNIGSIPPLVAGSWFSIDVPVNLATFTGFKEFAITSPNLNNKLWYDNLYVYKGTALGVSKFETSKIKMYPNPVSNELNIEANSTIQKIAVYNILGQEVLSSNPKSNSAKLQTSSLKNGVYFVTTTIDDVVSSSKLIKN